MHLCDVIIVSSINRMLRAVAAVVIIILYVSTFVLRLKAAESFLETNQSTSEHNSVEVQKYPVYETRKEQILSGSGEDFCKEKR